LRARGPGRRLLPQVRSPRAPAHFRSSRSRSLPLLLLPLSSAPSSSCPSLPSLPVPHAPALSHSLSSLTSSHLFLLGSSGRPLPSSGPPSDASAQADRE